MIGPIPRHLFLKMGLALPASAAAAPAFGAIPLAERPPSQAVKWAYLEWLDRERRQLHRELFPEMTGRGVFIPVNTGAGMFHHRIDGTIAPSASTRAIPCSARSASRSRRSSERIVASGRVGICEGAAGMIAAVILRPGLVALAQVALVALLLYGAGRLLDAAEALELRR